MTSAAHAAVFADRVVAELYDAHASTVLALCRVLLRDGFEAEDAAQQTFLSAYRSLRNGVLPRERGAWIAAIARNECRARLRRRTMRPPALALVADELPAPEPPASEFPWLVDAIRELPRRQRHALVLRHVWGLSAREAASALEVEPRVVEALVYRARKELRTAADQ